MISLIDKLWTRLNSKSLFHLSRGYGDKTACGLTFRATTYILCEEPPTGRACWNCTKTVLAKNK